MGSRIRVVISGATGRMGRTVARLAAADDAFEVIGGVDRDSSVEPPPEVPTIATIESSEALLHRADVVIDFSATSFLRQLLEQRVDVLDGSALVIGTTGIGGDEERLLEVAAQQLAVITAPNFSLGVNVLAALAERAAAALGGDFDIEIVEAHHRLKEDAPSGTALALGEAVASARGLDLEAVRRDGRSGRPGPRPDGEIGFHAIRGGDIIGDHHIHFIGDHERIELTHRASDRALFAAGALRAARWIAGKQPGRYTMRDVLDL